MNPRVVVINGPTGVGKTTVMSLLASRVPGSVSITGDAVRRFAPTDPAVTRALLGEGSTYLIGGHLVALYLRAGAATVFFDYVFDTAVHIERFTAHLPPEASYHMVTLWAAEATLTRRRAGRARAWPPAHLAHDQYRSMEANLAALGHVFHTDELAPEEICARILAKFFEQSSESGESIVPRSNVR
jgi:hypothetical protein